MQIYHQRILREGYQFLESMELTMASQGHVVQNKFLFAGQEKLLVLTLQLCVLTMVFLAFLKCRTAY